MVIKMLRHQDQSLSLWERCHALRRDGEGDKRTVRTGEPPQANGGGEPPQAIGANIGSC